MNKYIINIGIHLLSFGIINAQASEFSDPFSHSKHVVSTENEDLKTGDTSDLSLLKERLSNGSLCHQSALAQAGQIPFSALRLVGVLIAAENTMALFANEEDQIFSAYVEDFISADKLQVKAITKRGVDLLAWETNCHKAESIKLKW